MSDDASLTDFLDESDDAETTASEEAVPAEDDGGTADEDDEGRVQPNAVDPATSTAAWSADGAACEECGTVVALRWQGEAGLVCPECKEW